MEQKDNGMLIKEQSERLEGLVKKIARKMLVELYTPKHIIHNWKTDETIVIWKNGDKTTVRLKDGDAYNEYNAFTAALAKYLLGSNTKIKKIVKMTELPFSSNKHRNERRTECLIEKCTPKKKKS